MFNQFQLYQSIDVKIEEHTTLVSLYLDMQSDPCRVAGVTLSFRSSAGRAALPVCISIDGVEKKFHQTNLLIKAKLSLRPDGHLSAIFYPLSEATIMDGRLRCFRCH